MANAKKTPQARFNAHNRLIKSILTAMSAAKWLEYGEIYEELEDIYAAVSRAQYNDRGREYSDEYQY